MKKMNLLVLIPLVLQGCDEMPYQPQSTYSKGYSETRLDHNLFRVTVHGEEDTSRERVYDFTLLRSAELTLQNGYKYFVIVESNTDDARWKTKTPVTVKTTKVDAKTDSFGITTPESTTTTVSGGKTHVHEEPGLVNVIACYEEKQKEGLSYDARLIYESLSEKYKIKK